MQKITEIQQCTDDIIRSRGKADRIANNLGKLNKKELAGCSTDYLQELNEASQELKYALLNHTVDVRVWDGIKELRDRIKRELNRRNNDGENTTME